MAWSITVAPCTRETALAIVGKANAYVSGLERQALLEAKTILQGMLGPYPLSGYIFEITASGAEFIETLIFRASKTS